VAGDYVSGLSVLGVEEIPLAYAPALLLLQDIAPSYRVWITLNKLLYAPLQGDLFVPDILQRESLCGWLLPSELLVSEKTSSRILGE